MSKRRKELIRTLLKGIETGDEEAVAVVNPHQYIQHNPDIGDGLSSLRAALSERTVDGNSVIQYRTNHRLLAEGNFVLSVSEGAQNDIHTSFYDLFRLSKGKLVEHWDTTETVPERTEWKNDNGKF
ncbi:MAG: putative SnoaL-like aldol condensation-catalyzing enzyme [Candidatus Latescibacterota bacterium]|jgi:predicted SnoaL-like aldol condensation-catalyzing enzyme